MTVTCPSNQSVAICVVSVELMTVAAAAAAVVFAKEILVSTMTLPSLTASVIA